MRGRQPARLARENGRDEGSIANLDPSPATTPAVGIPQSFRKSMKLPLTGGPYRATCSIGGVAGKTRSESTMPMPMPITHSHAWRGRV